MNSENRLGHAVASTAGPHLGCPGDAIHGTSTSLYCPGAVGGVRLIWPPIGQSPPLADLLYAGYIWPQTITDVRDFPGLISAGW